MSWEKTREKTRVETAETREKKLGRTGVSPVAGPVMNHKEVLEAVSDPKDLPPL